ncbi:MAG: permease prefix domain 2-containing transporter [Terriglobales bacterium]
MMSQSTLAHPPRIASWLVELFASAEQAESILGDLSEEFSDLASRSGIDHARRWYWRQSAKTIAHLANAALHVARPWLAVAFVLGFLLTRFSAPLPEQLIVALLRTQRPYSNRHYEDYVWLLTYGIPIVRFTQSLLIGCIVAGLAKGREMVATMTFSLLRMAMIASRLFILFGHTPPARPVIPFLAPFSVCQMAARFP